MRRPTGLLAAVAATAMLASGCASGSPGELSGSASAALRPAVQAVREAAASGSYAQLRAAVADLKRLVRSQSDSGDVSASRANAIEDAADVLLNDARPAPKPVTTTTLPTATPTATSESPTPSPTPSTPSPTPTTESPSPTASLSAGFGPHSPKPQQHSSPSQAALTARSF